MMNLKKDQILPYCSRKGGAAIAAWFYLGMHRKSGRIIIPFLISGLCPEISSDMAETGH
jgi:hypothetical protein